MFANPVRGSRGAALLHCACERSETRPSLNRQGALRCRTRGNEWLRSQARGHSTCATFSAAASGELTPDSFGSRPTGSSPLRHERERPLRLALDLQVEPREEPVSEVRRSFDRPSSSASRAVHHRRHTWCPVEGRFRSQTAARVRPGRGRWPDQYAISALGQRRHSQRPLLGWSEKSSTQAESVAAVDGRGCTSR